LNEEQKCFRNEEDLPLARSRLRPIRCARIAYPRKSLPARNSSNYAKQATTLLRWVPRGSTRTVAKRARYSQGRLHLSSLFEEAHVSPRMPLACPHPVSPRGRFRIRLRLLRSLDLQPRNWLHGVFLRPVRPKIAHLYPPPWRKIAP
jgi:hypothetical protein